MKLQYLPFIFLLFLSHLALSQSFPFIQRKTWQGNYDIKMIAAPNLEPVYLDTLKANRGVLKADSLIRYETIVMTGDLFDINNRFKGGSPFLKFNIPLPSLACKDPNMACYDGLTLATPNTACPVRYSSRPPFVTRTVAMAYTDYDTDLTTYSSSMAELQIPEGSMIEAAYLYWAGNFKTNNPNIIGSVTKSYKGDTTNIYNTFLTSGYNKVKFKKPNGNYEAVTSQTNYVFGEGYICVSDISSLIKASKSGPYWVGNIQSYPMEGNSGSSSGWTLVVIYNTEDTKRSISLFDGCHNIPSGSSEIFTLTGFQAPSFINIRSYMGYATLDGENIASEIGSTEPPNGLKLQTNTGSPIYINPFCTDQSKYKLWNKKGIPATSGMSDNQDLCKKPLFDQNWASVCDGISSSKISSYNEINNLNGNEIVRLPNNRNTLGYDSHHIRLPDGSVTPNSTQATITIYGEPSGFIIPFMFYLAVEQSPNPLGNEDILTYSKNSLISPNPLTNSSILKLDMIATGILTVDIFSLSGENVKSFQTSSSYELKKSDFNSGVYFVKISDVQGNQRTEKLIVE